MKAPSERHLEDWIVDNAGMLAPIHIPVTLLSRQLPLPSGRLDLLIRWGVNLEVVELKKDAITEAAVMQTLRYMYDIKKIWGVATEYLPQALQVETSGNGLYHCPIYGHLIGHSITPVVLRCAEAAEISVSLYDYDGEYEIEDVCSDQPDYAVLEEFSYGLVGIAMRSILAHYNKAAAPTLDTSGYEALWRRMNNG